MNLNAYDPTEEPPPLTPCLGIGIHGNTFENNFGCPKYGGRLIGLECLTDTQTEKRRDERRNLDIPKKYDEFD